MESDTYTFGNERITRRRKTHAVDTYDAHNDIVTCLCGEFTGPVDEFHTHNRPFRKGNNRSALCFLDDISLNRWDYFAQGKVNNSTG